MMLIPRASMAGLALLAAAAMIACSSGSDAPQSVAPADQAERIDQPAAQQADGAAMVGTIIESGHRAGLTANRNTLGRPDAPIVIAEYSDFL